MKAHCSQFQLSLPHHHTTLYGCAKEKTKPLNEKLEHVFFASELSIIKERKLLINSFQFF